LLLCAAFAKAEILPVKPGKEVSENLCINDDVQNREDYQARPCSVSVTFILSCGTVSGTADCSLTLGELVSIANTLDALLCP
jgi:hypothetical protein